MSKLGILSTIIICLCLNACLTPRNLSRLNSSNNEDKNTEPISLNEVRITPKRNDDFRVIPPKVIDIEHVDLEVSFNWGKHECIGKEIITLKPYFYATDSIVLDAKNMIFSEIVITDLENSPIQYLTTYDKKVLRIQLERKILPQESIKVLLRYTAKPDEMDGVAINGDRDDKGLYFINTDHGEPYKPLQLWTQGEVEASSNWFPIIDKPNEKFTLKLAITVNKDLTTFANGVLISSTINGNQKTDIWESKKVLPAYLVVMAVGDFKITKDYLTTISKDSFVTTTYDTFKVKANDSLFFYTDSIVARTKMNYKTTTKDLLNGVEVSYYLEPNYSPYALGIFKHTPEMIDFFAGKLGVDYPWEKYAQVVVHDYVAGAMENTSATVHNEFVQKNFRELIDNENDDIISHELFHQWFGDLVTCKSWSHLVLNEGFATYGEHLWLEYKYGRDESLLKSTLALESYLNYVKRGNDDPIIQFNYKHADDMFNPITYQKGALVLQLLRAEIGDDAFFLALKNYLTNYAYQNAEIDELRRECENVSGKDLRLFFTQWFYKGGHPSIDIRYDYNDSTKRLGITIEQVQNNQYGVFKFPLKFKVTQADQVKYFNFDIEKRVETFFVERFDTSINEFPNVFVDPDAIFIGEIKDNKPFLSHIKSYHGASNYIEKFRSLSALNLIQTSIDTAREVILTAINDPNPEIRAKAIEWTNWSDFRNLTIAKYILIEMAKSDPSTKVRLQATSALADLKDGSLFTLLMDLSNDSSYNIAAKALQGIYKILPEEALRLSANLEKDAKRDLLFAISDIYSNVGTASQANFYEDRLMRVFNRSRMILIDDYADYCIRLNQKDIFKLAIGTLSARMNTDQSNWNRVAAVVALNQIMQKLESNYSVEKDIEMRAELKSEIATLKENIQRAIDQEKEEDTINLLKLRGFTQSSDIIENK
ncbi:MAG TPA: M1 family aminopeptidase [Chitinophagaceae bacterium]|nr:M1 family aminopeptidase [Chitinophagaceae bacterium]